ncbi:WAP four-disulfide core domain protein 2 [Ursus maritimus]|uniref:WAP four-disulfide core domain protein 2 n=1 Tax=Ursus maritimus TaxID=29073 RepID=A0A8M1GIM4_URSMA|nr:WAP four-disulfide core domain protein 2 [Ursus maritimus]
MPACRPAPLAVALLLGLLLLGLPRVPGEDAKKPGVCPQLQADLNCTQECLSDAQCAGNLKCCQAGCATRCHLPNEKQGTCPKVSTDFPQLGLCQDQCLVYSLRF